MKIAMLQFDERTENENINSILTINKKYCEKQNYDYIFKALKEEDTHRHQLDDYLREQTTEKIFRLNVYDYRIYMIEKYMNDYDYIVYVDSDLVIYNPNFKIENLIDDVHDIFMFSDSGKINVTIGLMIIANAVHQRQLELKTQYLTTALKDFEEIKNYGSSILERLNLIAANPDALASGFMIINCRSKLLKSFIDDFKRFYPLFEDSLFDQGCIATLLRMTKYNKMLKILPNYLIGNPFYNEDLPIYKEFALDRERAFLCHFDGPKKNTEVDKVKRWLKEIIENKFWN